MAGCSWEGEGIHNVFLIRLIILVLMHCVVNLILGGENEIDPPCILKRSLMSIRKIKLSNTTA